MKYSIKQFLPANLILQRVGSERQLFATRLLDLMLSFSFCSLYPFQHCREQTSILTQIL